MADGDKHGPGSTSLDPFRGVEPKSITEIELEQDVAVEREELPDAAKLTDLPWLWIVLATLVCVGASLVGQFVEVKHLKKVVQESGLLKPEEKQAAEDAEQIVADREKIQQRLRELKDRKRKLRELTEEPAQEEKDITDVPLTIEGLRAEIRDRAGESFENYRRFGTLGALVIGGFGLILLALFVRALWAALFGGVAFAACFLAGLDPWITWGVAALAAAVGAWLGPKLLLAAVVSNTMFAGLVIGGILAGGSVYLGTASELYALIGLGAGAVLGLVLGYKFARPLFLSAVLANTAGMSATALWLIWGDLYPFFWPSTLGGLMLFDGVATRLYHRLRWAE